MKMNWIKTTTGWIGQINNVGKWFIRKVQDTGIYEVYEIVQGEDGCLLRNEELTLNNAKYRAYEAELGRAAQ